MNKEKHEYLKMKKLGDEKVIRTEIYFTPLLIIFPFIVGVLLINDWYFNDFLLDEYNRFSELIIGLIIIIGNILFDVPFVKSLTKFYKEK